MFIKLLAVFIVIPLIELVILIKVGSYIGLWPTILIVVLTGIVGASLARYQGFIIINKIRSDVSSGRVPARELIDGTTCINRGNSTAYTRVSYRYMRIYTSYSTYQELN